MMSKSLTIKLYDFVIKWVFNPWFILLSAFIISLFTFNDYGIAWDEPVQRLIGINAYLYFKGQLGFDYIENFGPIYEVFLVIIERISGFTDSRDIYILRHFANHFVFLLAVLCFYFIVKEIFNKKGLALLAMLFLLISPRMYAHSFVNTKDIPFLCFTLFSVLMLLKYFKTGNYIFLLLFSIFSGIMINIRLAGLLIFLLFALLLIIFHLQKKCKWYNQLLRLMAVTLLTGFSLYISWPYLWENTFARINSFFCASIKYFWDGKVLYMGSIYNASNLPWHYLPVWIGISIPLNYLILFIFSVPVIIVSVVKNGFQSHKNLYLTFFLSLILIPICVYYLKNSTIYDDWRHFYFIYPALIICSIAAVDFFLNMKLFFAKIITLFTILFSVVTLIWMFNNHPFQIAYLNQLIPQKTDYVRFHYEQDYWGVCFKQGFEYILKHDSSEKIQFVVTKLPGEFNPMILKPSERLRFVYQPDFSKADYFITHYREENYDFPDLGKPWYFFSVNNSRIMAIWKLKE